MSGRTFLPSSFEITSWDDLKPFFESLAESNLDSPDELQSWITNRDELENVISEDLAWRYIRMTCDTGNEEAKNAYLQFVNEIQPHLSVWSDKLNNKLVSANGAAELEKEQAYFIYLRSVRKSVEMFRKENVPIQTELQQLSQKYSSIQGAMTVEWEGKELTLQQLALKLKDTDRSVREKAFALVSERRLQDENELDELFNQMIQLRHQLAVNAGYENYADYMFDARGRFDYRMEDCFAFHKAVEEKVVPLYRQMIQERANQMQLKQLKPWDTDVHPLGLPPLKPFEDSAELLAKGIRCLNEIDPFFGACLEKMNKMGHLDLESRKGKSPGGYNYPLMETGVPFIFMNAAGSLRDLETLVHEAGHAVHSFYAQDLPLGIFRNTPSEVAELASMSMELISMPGWKVFFTNKEDYKRAQKEQLQGILGTLPWIARVDAFQHWLYQNPHHSVAERKAYWNQLGDRFGSGDIIDWSGWEKLRDSSWQRQLHIFELPFYYIEYGFAQLGAIGVWKNVLKDAESGLKAYQQALKLGYTRSIPEIYETAGVTFAFDPEHVESLMNTVEKAIDDLKS